jgi:hypothetical protein
MAAILATGVLAFAQKFGELPEKLPGKAPVGSPWAGKKWKIKFFHDEVDSEFTINDFQFAGNKYGFAAGLRADKGRVKPMALVTRDGGATWNFQPLRGVALSVFPLDETHVWVVTEKDLYTTEEGGAQWKKLKRPDGAFRVYFKDALNGWAFGAGKTIYRSLDGGKSWLPVPESKSLELTDEHTSFTWMEFVADKVGIVVGNSMRPRREGRVPDWMDPEMAAARRQVPTTAVFMETRDGGASWKPSISSIFGRVMKVDMHVPWSLALFRYQGSFEFSSEVLEIDITNGKSRPLFRRRDMNVTDITMMKGGQVAVAGVDLPGKFKDSPIPSHVRVAVTSDRAQWYELEVDYKAFGSRAMMAWLEDGNGWLATDAGMILKLENK